MTPHYSIWIMFIVSCIIGFITMPIMLGFTSPYIRYHSNKVISSLLMGFLMGLVEVIMHSSMMSRLVFIIYFIIFSLCSIIMVWMLQTQWFVSVDSFLNGMVEHHAMALVMVKPFLQSRHKDVAILAKNIKKTQEKEIKIMDKIMHLY
jgi:hypothetical protein